MWSGRLHSLKNLKLCDLSFLAVRFEFEETFWFYLVQSKMMFLIYQKKNFPVWIGPGLDRKEVGHPYILCEGFGHL